MKANRISYDLTIQFLKLVDNRCPFNQGVGAFREGGCIVADLLPVSAPDPFQEPIPARRELVAGILRVAHLVQDAGGGGLD